MPKIAIVRVRGLVNINSDVKLTLEMLRLYNKNYCVVIEDTPANKGMLKKVKDFVTYGFITEDFFKELVSKKGREFTSREKDSKGVISYQRKYFEIDGKKYKKYFRLSPPRKGYGRKGIKKPFRRAGALGDRGEKITDLIQRMM